jgi:hypothetical protein
MDVKSRRRGVTVRQESGKHTTPPAGPITDWWGKGSRPLMPGNGVVLEFTTARDAVHLRHPHFTPLSPSAQSSSSSIHNRPLAHPCQHSTRSAAQPHPWQRRARDCMSCASRPSESGKLSAVSRVAQVQQRPFVGEPDPAHHAREGQAGIAEIRTQLSFTRRPGLIHPQITMSRSWRACSTRWICGTRTRCG